MYDFKIPDNYPTKPEEMEREEFTEICREARRRIPKKIDKLKGFNARELASFKRGILKKKTKDLNEEDELFFARHICKENVETFIVNEVFKRGKKPPSYFFLSPFSYWDME